MKRGSENKHTLTFPNNHSMSCDLWLPILICKFKLKCIVRDATRQVSFTVELVDGASIERLTHAVPHGTV